MSTVQRKTPDASETNDSNDTLQPQMTIHPVGYSGMPMHMYPFPAGLTAPVQPLRSKRRQVKNACTNCQKACKKCDDARPCLRCVKYGISEECIDSQRKERKKGVKRGPYKKRDGKDRASNNADQVEVPVQQAIPLSQGVPAPSSSPPMAPYMNPMGYPPGFYSQFPAPPTPKPGDGTPYFPQFYIAPMQMAGHPGQEGHDGQGYPHPQFYPATFLPYAQPYPPYMMPHRPDGQMSVPAPHYGYAPPVYAKPPSAGGSSDSGHGYRGDTGRHGEHGEDK